MGRIFHVGAGVVEQAVAQGAPITLALLYPDLLGGYQLRLKPLSPNLSVHGILQAYFDYLAEMVAQAPWAWQGWHWYSGLAQSPATQAA
jgi:hypothetical protein